MRYFPIHFPPRSIKRFSFGAGIAFPAPAAPTGLTANPVSTSQIDLAWTDNATTETAYKVYRSTDGVSYSQVGTDLAADSNSYSDATITAGTTYYYKVAAVNGSGETLSTAVQANTLTLGLKSYWKLEEAAASNRADSVGSNTLIQANSPTQETGIIANAAGFASASSQRLTATLSDVPTGAQAHSIAFWIYPTSVSGVHVIYHMGITTAQYDHYILQSGNDVLYRLEGAGGTGVVTVTLSGALPAINAWHFICCWWAGGANDMYASVDNGTPQHTALGGMTPDADALTFALGSTVAGASYLDARLDEVGLWNRALGSTEITALYNGGAGGTYPF